MITCGRTCHKSWNGEHEVDLFQHASTSPDSSCSNWYQSSIEHSLMTQCSPILGDFNAHHQSWYSGSIDTRGIKMSDSINGSDHGIFDWDIRTRVPPNAKPSPPGVSIASASLITLCSWQTLPMLSSDQLPILIRLQMKAIPKPGLRQTHINLKKANSDRYRQKLEATMSKLSLPTACQRDEKIYRTNLLKTASHHASTGRLKLHEEAVPAEILDMMIKRTTSAKETLSHMNCQDWIKTSRNAWWEHKREK